MKVIYIEKGYCGQLWISITTYHGNSSCGFYYIKLSTMGKDTKEGTNSTKYHLFFPLYCQLFSFIIYEDAVLNGFDGNVHVLSDSIYAFTTVPG